MMYFKPSLWQRLRWAIGMAVAVWRASRSGYVVTRDADDEPGDVADRIRAAEERAKAPHRRIEN